MLAVASIWLIPARVAVIYAGLLLLIRLRGKKEMGRLSPMDFLSMLLLSEAVSPAMTDGDSSLGAAGLAAASLVAVSFVTAWLSFRFRAAERLLDGTPSVLIRDGQVDAKTRTRESISDQELAMLLRQAGIDSPSQVRLATVEPSGKISILRHPTGGSSSGENDVKE
jgi:uncharacterized membrane protein YcaP (DUF421 family)